VTKIIKVWSELEFEVQKEVWSELEFEVLKVGKDLTTLSTLGTLILAHCPLNGVLNI
jgi:hypothetical protein